MRHVHHIEFVSVKEPAYGIDREIMQMGWRMDHAPMPSPESRIERTNVTGRDREQAARLEISRRLRDDQVRAPQMLDRVPHGDEIDWAVDRKAKVVGFASLYLRNVVDTRLASSEQCTGGAGR